MKFIAKDGTELIINEDFSLVNKETSPLKEIIERKDFSSFVFVDDQTIPFSEITQIQVNVIEVGVMIFLFQTSEFNKEDFIYEVSKLKELSIMSFYDVLNKMKSLYSVAQEFRPLFVIYNPNGKYRIYDDCFKTIYSGIKTLYVSNHAEEVIVKNSSSVEKPHYTQQEKVKTKDKKSSFHFVNPIPVIQNDKFHFLFAVVATLLCGFTLSIGIHDAYAGKMLCIFFFICSLAGAFLNFMIYKDTFVKNEIKSMYSILTIFSSVLGIGLSVGGYFIFKALSKDELAVKPHFMMILGLIVAIYLISSAISYLVIYLKKRKK